MKSDQDFLRNIFCFQKFEWILFQDDFESELLKKKKSLKVHFLFVCVTQKKFHPFFLKSQPDQISRILRRVDLNDFFNGA